MPKIVFKLFLVLLITVLGRECVLAQEQLKDNPPQKKLDSLKQQNNLSEWIYIRLDYVYPEPRKRLKFLLESQQKAWRKPNNDEEKVAWLLLLSSQGYYELQNGNILSSINYYEDAHKYYDAHNTIDFDVSEYIYKPLSNNYTRLGDYERAVFVQKSMIKLAVSTGNKKLEAATRNNLAISYRSMGKFNEALKEIATAFKLSGMTSENGIMLSNVKADIYYDLQEYTVAEATVKANIKIQEKTRLNSNNAYTLVGSYVSLGNILSRKNNLSDAGNAFLKALNLMDRFFKDSRQRERANVLNQVGKSLLERQEPLKAINYFNNALKIFEIAGADNKVKAKNIYGDNNVIEALYNRARAYLQLKQPDKALEELQYALIAADRIRFELADEKTRQRFQADTKAIAEKAISIGYAQYVATGKESYGQIILKIAEQSKARTLLDAIRRNQQQALLKNNDTLLKRRQLLERAIIFNEKQQLLNNGKADNNDMHLYELSLVENELKKKYPVLVTQGDLLNSNYAELMKNADPKRHILEYFSGDSAIYIIHIKGKNVVTITQVPDAGALKQQITAYVKTYFNNGPDAMLNDPKAFYNTSFELYQLLIPASLRQVKSYTIIPDGVIGYLSFDGLVTGQQYKPAISRWPFLIKKAEISYAFSLQTLLNNKAAERKTAGFTGFFITYEGDKVRYLPAVKEEAKTIQAAIGGNFLYDQSASAAGLVEAINQPGVLHLSTHAALFGDQQAPVLGMADHQVFLFELTARQQAPDLVVLSACQTANGTLKDGEGIISFARGFTALGAKGTIAGLWNLNDEAAATIMGNFYKNLSAGMQVAVALREAKLQQLKEIKGSEAQYLPYYWNAMVYMGNDQQLMLPAKSNFLWIAMSILSVLVLIGGGFFLKSRLNTKK